MKCCNISSTYLSVTNVRNGNDGNHRMSTKQQNNKFEFWRNDV